MVIRGPWAMNLSLMTAVSMTIENIKQQQYHIHFEGHFESSAPNDPQVTLRTSKSKVFHIGLTHNPSHKYQPGSHWSQLRVSISFNTSAPNHLKMTFNTNRSEIRDLCSTSTHDSQISTHFVLRLTFGWQAVPSLVLLAISTWLHSITSKIPWA